MKLRFDDMEFTPEYLVQLVNLHKEGKISGTTAKSVLENSLKNNEFPEKIVEEKGLTQINNNDEIISVIKNIIKNNPKPLEEYRSGKVAVLKFFVGQVMR